MAAASDTGVSSTDRVRELIAKEKRVDISMFLVTEEHPYDPIEWLLCKKHLETATYWFGSPASIDGRSFIEGIEGSVEGTCPICGDDLAQDACSVKRCGHHFHAECALKSFAACGNKCPACNAILGPLIGPQPEGRMMIDFMRTIKLEGEDPDAGVFVITYIFLDGVQDERHPAKGMRYAGTSRRAFLPACSKGQKFLRRMMQAWDARQLFNVGRSLTTGKDNCVIWNTIHHKTSFQGGPYNFAYPDPGYFERLDSELNAIGIY